MYHHYTTATDSVNSQVVFDMVIDQVVKENLSATQLLWLPTKLIYLFLYWSTKLEILITVCLQMLFSIKVTGMFNVKQAVFILFIWKDFK